MELTLTNVNLLFAFVLLILGLYCVASKTNMLKLAVGIGVLAKSAMLCFIAFGGSEIQAVVLVIIAVDAAVVAVALALMVAAWKHTKSLDVSKLRRLRG